MKFGKHKLAPAISPKKTVEGAIGGLLGAVVGCAVYGKGRDHLRQVQGVIWGNLVLLALVLSVVDQFGDLSFSLIKREFKTKDYGNIMPGHGGMLDRFDGVCSSRPPVIFCCA
jgi:phosphatidate cytidylyltransferase